LQQYNIHDRAPRYAGRFILIEPQSIIKRNNRGGSNRFLFSLPEYESEDFPFDGRHYLLFFLIKKVTRKSRLQKNG
jgi:hypothetical protein